MKKKPKKKRKEIKTIYGKMKEVNFFLLEKLPKAKRIIKKK